jgi:hypothetical protein
MKLADVLYRYRIYQTVERKISGTTTARMGVF